MRGCYQESRQATHPLTFTLPSRFYTESRFFKFVQNLSFSKSNSPSKRDLPKGKIENIPFSFEKTREYPFEKNKMRAEARASESKSMAGRVPVASHAAAAGGGQSKSTLRRHGNGRTASELCCCHIVPRNADYFSRLFLAPFLFMAPAPRPPPPAAAARSTTVCLASSSGPCCTPRRHERAGRPAVDVVARFLASSLSARVRSLALLASRARAWTRPPEAGRLRAPAG